MEAQVMPSTLEAPTDATKELHQSRQTLSTRVLGRTSKWKENPKIEREIVPSWLIFEYFQTFINFLYDRHGLKKILTSHGGA